MENFSSRAELIIDLQDRGYDHDFIIYNEGILCVQGNELIGPDDFEIAETHHFESKNGSGDNFIIYAINLLHSDAKGILMTSFSTYNRGVSIHLWCKLSGSIKKTLTEVRDRSLPELVFT
jgi:hypothetical protein